MPRLSVSPGAGVENSSPFSSPSAPFFPRLFRSKGRPPPCSALAVACFLRFRIRAAAGVAPTGKMKTPYRKGAQIRETTGFERTFSAHTAQKNPEIRQVFPDFSILSGRKISRSKTALHAKSEIFCVGRGEKHRNTGYVFRAFSTMSGAKRSFLRCRIPILHALKAGVFDRKGQRLALRRARSRTMSERTSSTSVVVIVPSTPKAVL